MYKNFENVLTTPSIEANATTRNVIRRRYSPQEVPWRRIHNAIAKAMSIFNNTPHSALKRHSLPQGAREESSVAFSNKVMDARDWHSLRGVPPKHDISCFDFKHLLNTVFMFFKYPSPDTSVSTSPSVGEVLKHILRPHCTPSARNFLARVPLLYTSLKNPVASGAHCGRNRLDTLLSTSYLSPLPTGSGR